MHGVVIKAMLVGLLTAAHVSHAQTRVGGPDESGDVRSADTRHILTKDRATAQQLLESIVAVPKADRLGKFKAVARAASQDPGSAPSGGDLGEVFQGEMVRSFESEIFASRVSEVTGPFQSEFGWHLSYVTAFRSTPVREICEASLRTVLRSTGTSPSQGLLLARATPREVAHKVKQLLGSSWEGPWLDDGGNLVYVERTGPGSDGLHYVARHTEYHFGRLHANPRPMACVRSQRERWAVDCEKIQVALADYGEFEGRAGDGRMVTGFSNATRLRLDGVVPGTLGGQLFEYACKGKPFPAGAVPPWARKST